MSKEELLHYGFLPAGIFSFPTFRLQLKHWFFLDLKPASPQTKLHYWHSWFSGLQTQTGTTPSAFLDLQLANLKSWELLASITAWADSLWNLSLYVSPSFILSLLFILFLYRTLANTVRDGYYNPSEILQKMSVNVRPQQKHPWEVVKAISRDLGRTTFATLLYLGSHLYILRNCLHTNSISI